MPMDRKSDKKWKDLSASSPPKTDSNQGAGLQLDAILSTLDSKSGKESAEVYAGRVRKKVKMEMGGGKGKGKGRQVSALDLLSGALDGLISSAKQGRKNERGGSKSAIQAPSIEKEKNKGNFDLETSSAQSTVKGQSLDKADSLPPTPTTVQPHATTNPLPPHLESVDVSRQLKAFKTALRTLITTLQTLVFESALADRVWYKNASQFKSAFWWTSFNSTRRGLHKLLPPPTLPTQLTPTQPHQHHSISQRGLAKDTVRMLTIVYAGLGGGEEALQSQQAKFEPESGWANLPKFDVKPSATTLYSFLQSDTSQNLLSATKAKLELLRESLEVLQKRTQTTGHVLVTHLNTPPAPTFAPLVTTLLVLVASMSDPVRVALEGGRDEADRGQEMEVGSIGVLMDLLREWTAK
uniref:Uncharacterized protein n=1 Tax=Ustilago esculenta TaxID=185366 RepID=A0A481SHE8_9BASI|nr:hypothetical protein UEMT_2006 [Ustilago esculenta]